MENCRVESWWYLEVKGFLLLVYYYINIKCFNFVQITRTSLYLTNSHVPVAAYTSQWLTLVFRHCLHLNVVLFEAPCF